MTESELGGFISTVEHPEAREQFRSDLRRALVSAAATEWSSPGAVAASRRPWLDLPTIAAPRYALAVAMVVLAVFSAGGVAAASSLPGDAGYSLKQAYEQVELALASDDTTKVEVLTRQSDRRIDELSKVTASRPEHLTAATAALEETVAKLQAALVSLRPSGQTANDDREDQAVNDVESAAEKHVAALESIKQHANTPAIEKALQQAKELEQKAKDKKKHRDTDAGDQAKEDEPKTDDARPGTAPAQQRTAPTPRVTPKPTPTPKTDGLGD